MWLKGRRNWKIEIEILVFYGRRIFLGACFKKKNLPRIAIQASFCLLWVASSDKVTTRGTPPTPVKSTPEFPNRIQSIKLWPGAKAVLFRGLPGKIQKNKRLFAYAFKHMHRNSREWRRRRGGGKNIFLRTTFLWCAWRCRNI